MALINGIYVHVVDESVDQSVETSSHPVENGAEITDHIKNNPLELSISGEIVDYTGYTQEARQGQSNITAWISLVKKDKSAFDTMSFERLNNELLAFEGGTKFVDTGAIQYLDEENNTINCSLGGTVAIGNMKMSINVQSENTQNF